MLISPSIASGDPLRLADEISYCDEHFGAIHLDVADGVAVRGITFGLRTCEAACQLSCSSNISIHLEVNDPALHVADVVRCGADVVFVQVDNVNDPVGNLRLYLEAGLTAGANVSNLDLGRPYLDELLALSPYVLVGTTAHDDKAQTCRPDMLEFAKRVAADGIHEVWVDGGITAEIFYGLADSAIHAAVLGRAIFADKDCAINLFCR